MADLESILAFITDIAEQAGDLIVELRAHNQLNHDYKQGIELVTNADVAADKLITQAIRERFPDHQILAEESNPDFSSIEMSDTPLWVIDPIDGTVNYARHHLQVAISIAYVVKGKIQVALVYNPFLAEMFTAIRHSGAWLNDQPIRCSQTLDLKKSLIATGFPYDKSKHLPQLMAQLTSVLENCADVRRIGSAAIDLCWVALGRLDGYYETVSPWDCAAGWLIAKEAGAKCGYFKTPHGGVKHELHSENLLVTNPNIHDALKHVLNQADPEYSI